jgi:hypothetical protein
MSSPRSDSPSDADPGWPDQLTITDPDAAKLLLDPRRRPNLSPFLAGQATVSDAAEQTGQLPNSMLAAVRRMLALGLIEVTASTRRSGKEVRAYRAVAKSFFVGLDTIEDVLLLPEIYWQKTFNDSFRDTLIEHHYHHKPLGTLIKRMENGSVIVFGAEGHEEWNPPHNGPLVYFDWSVLQLNVEQAETLRIELDCMVARYRALPPLGTDVYLVGAHMTPLSASYVATQAATNSSATPS